MEAANGLLAVAVLDTNAGGQLLLLADVEPAVAAFGFGSLLLALTLVSSSIPSIFLNSLRQLPVPQMMYSTLSLEYLIESSPCAFPHTLHWLTGVSTAKFSSSSAMFARLSFRASDPEGTG